MPWAPDYLDLAAGKAYLGVADTLDDVEIQTWITAASRAVDSRCNRQFGAIAAPAARVYRHVTYDHGLGLWCIEIDDVQTVTGMTVGGVAFALAGAALLPDNAPADGRPWTRLAWDSPPTTPLTVVAQWGWSVTGIPPQVPAAVKLQMARWHARRNSPLGVAGSPEQGSELRLLSRLDPDVATTLTGLSRRRRVG